MNNGTGIGIGAEKKKDGSIQAGIGLGTNSTGFGEGCSISNDTIKCGYGLGIANKTGNAGGVEIRVINDSHIHIGAGRSGRFSKNGFGCDIVNGRISCGRDNKITVRSISLLEISGLSLFYHVIYYLALRLITHLYFCDPFRIKPMVLIMFPLLASSLYRYKVLTATFVLKQSNRPGSPRKDSIRPLKYKHKKHFLGTYLKLVIYLGRRHDELKTLRGSKIVQAPIIGSANRFFNFI